MHYQERTSRSGSTGSGYESEGQPGLDEFGRLVPSVKKPIALPKKEEWPPCFCDRHAVDYVLDARSGMFYHADCEFFYDPKSRLYYGNKQQCYFRHVENSTRQYVRVDDQGSSAAVMSSEPEAILDPKSRPTSAGSSTISIKLKTTKFATKKKTQNTKHTRESLGSASTNSTCNTVVTSAASTTASKEHTQNIGKWQERRQELALAPPTCTATPATTKVGEPVCLLCKRKFQTIEQLRRHEEISQMHKDNLVRAKNAEQQQAKQYVDRAQNRREMHGSSGFETVLLPATVMDPTNTFASLPEAPALDTFDPLGAQNVGRKMLQGMGWTHDKPEGNAQAREGISKEWDRIEHTMGKAQSQRGRR